MKMLNWYGFVIPYLSKNLKLNIMIQEMFEDMPILTSIIGVVLLFLLFVAIDGMFSKNVYFSGAERIERTNAAVAAKKEGKNKITASDVTGKQINSFSELKKFLNTMDGSDLTDCKAEIHNFSCAIVNNEMDLEQIKEYFSK